MTHPEELLAGYVDGTLSQSERMIVDEHLAGCALCRGEVALATSARAGLGALAEQPAPAEIAAAVRDAISHPPVKTTVSRMPARYRLPAGLAAAAVVALLVVLLPHLGGSSRSTNQLAAVGESATTKEGLPAQASSGGPQLEIQIGDYTTATVARLAQLIPTPRSPQASDSNFGGMAGTDAARQKALSCLQTAFAGIPGDPVRLIQATFQGQPAFIGVFTEGPGAGLPADTVTVRVASVSSCTVLTFTSSKV